MLVGRQVEISRVEALLGAAREGRGGALVLRGLAGSGKSTLLARVAEAADVRVLATSGVESEAPLGYAALQRLLWPLRSGIDQLPAPQRDALRAVMGEAAGPGDRFLVSLATLSLLSDAAEEQAVVVAVDDAHWLDEATAGALLFVARRLAAERVAIVFAVRDGSTRTFEARDVATVEIAGLDPEDAASLLAPYGEDGLDPAVVSTLHAAGDGNPLVLVELAKSLTPAQLAGRATLPTPLPLTDGVQQAFLERYRRLSAPAQRYLVLLAADDTGSIVVTHEAASAAGLDEDAVEEAEGADLVRVQDLSIDLSHPLVRSAIYQSATRTERRTAHHALAQALTSDPDRRAWHLAAATDRADDSIVGALSAVARRAVTRGSHDAASAAWRRASELTVDPGQRGELLALAATASWEAGRSGRAKSLAAAASELTTDPGATIGLLTLRGRIEWTTHSLDEGYDLILQAAALAAEVEGAGSETARRLAMLAASLAAFGGRSDRGLDPSTVVTEPGPDAAAIARVTHLLLRGFLAAARQDWSLLSLLQSALGLADEIGPVTDGVVQANLGIAALHLGDDVRGTRLHADQLLAARRAGAHSMVEHALKNGALFQIATGAWGRASAAAEEALALGADAGQPGLTALPRAELALLAALRGDDSVADEHLEQVGLLLREPVGVTRVLVTDLMHWARGLRAAQPETALQHLERMSGTGLPRTAAVDRLETAVRAGRRDLAEAWAADLLAFADATGMASALAAGEHGRALLTEGAEAEAAFERALAAHAGSPRVADQARTRLAYGEWLRRARRRVDAREHLRAALATFEELGATRWAERATQELRASGETARRRDPSTTRDLTAQERQVALLVRQGLSNRDAAAQLFVSPRTVDFHLRNVFTKLGLSSRAELAALPLG